MENKEIKDNNDKINKKSAVDRLVEAAHGDDSMDVETTMTVKRKKSNFLDSIPTIVKALFVKWWFVGASVFFFLWGLGNYITGNWDKILVFGIATGLVTNLLTNNFLRLIEKENNEYEKYSMFYTKKYWAFFLDIIYALLVTLLVVYTYNGINILIINCNPAKYTTSDVPLAVEPLLYGLIYLIYDMALISIKNLIRRLIKSKKIIKEA